MFHLEEVLQLKDTENVTCIVRRHPATLAPSLVLGAALIIMPFFFLFPLFRIGIIGVLIFLAAVLIGVVLAGRAVIIWDSDVLIVTSLRIVDVDQRGMFARFVTEIPVTAIRDAAWRRRGIADTLFGMGTLTIQGQSAEPLEVRRVGHPERLHELISDIRHATTPKRVDLAPEFRDRIRKISAMLEALSPEELDRAEEYIRSQDRHQAIEGFLKKPVRDGEHDTIEP